MRLVLTILFINLFLITSCTVETNPDEIVDGSTIEYEGKTYHVVQVGSQFWLKENLDVGTMIDRREYVSDNGIIEKYYYDNDSSYSDTYGGLYTWDEAMQYSDEEGAQGICPCGWHIPTHSELEEMQAAVNFNSNAVKAVGAGYGRGTGTDESGLSIYLGGYRSAEGGTHNAENMGVLWCSTEFNPLRAYRLSIFPYDSLFNLYVTNKDKGYSVRCVKD